VLRHVALILADVHVVKLGMVAGLDLDLLGHFAAGVDPVALQGAEDGPEAAFLCFEAALQGLDHLAMACGVFEMHVERGRIGGAGFGEAALPAPQLHAALVVRVEDPHVPPLPPKALDGAQLLTRRSFAGGGDKGEARAGRK
jgi:hypothetical protein